MKKKLLVTALGCLALISLMCLIPEKDSEATQTRPVINVEPVEQLVQPTALKEVLDDKPEVVASVNEDIIVEPTTEEITTEATTEEVVASTTEEVTTEATEEPAPVKDETPVEDTSEPEVVPEVETETDETHSGMTFYSTKTLTAYIETGNACADGVYPSVGYTVASNDPNLWHKWIYIDGVGTRYVHDHLASWVGTGTIDVFVSSYDEAIQFGSWSSSIYILDEQ